MNCLLGGVVFACATLFAAAPAVAAAESVPFQAFGYRDTILERGPNAALAVYLPVTHGLRTVRLHAPLEISPLVDPRSSIIVTANDVPVATYTVNSAGRNPTIDVNIPVPPNASSLAIAIVGRLFVLGDVCADLRNDDAWFTVSRDARLAITSDNVSSNDQVADFLNQYGGEFDVVQRGSDDTTRAATIQLADQLHQIERWRRVNVRLVGTPNPGARTVVVGTFPQDVAVRGNELDVTPRGVELVNDRIGRMLISNKISDISYDGAPAADKRLSLADLGVTTRTLRGAGELPFDIPMTYGAFGGVPEHLRLHVDLVHTPIRTADRAFVQVLVNNTLIGSYDMTGKGNVERFDVPLDVDALSSSTIVRVVPTFYYERDGCKGNYPSFTTTLNSDTNFQWDGIDRRALSVGEFIRAVSGRVAVLVDDRSNDRAAFALVSAIGTVNSAIRSIEVLPYTGSVPSGYDYAIVVGSGDHIAALNPQMLVNGRAFTIFGSDGKTVRYKADYSSPFGVLETALPGGVPTLIATYWKDPAVLGGIANLQPDDLAAQSDNLFIFNASQATYDNRDEKPAAPRDAFALSIPEIIGIFALVLLGVVVVAVRRKV
jgi:hypothetical protein